MKYCVKLGNCLEELKSIPDESCRCCVTSPPYWGLRDYANDEQLGMEDTPQEFVANMVKVFQEVKRILTPDGTFWLNIGDSYVSAPTGSRGKCTGKDQGFGENHKHSGAALKRRDKRIKGLPEKNLIGVPWRLALALQDDGWILRQDIIWAKKNCMPECLSPDTQIFIKQNNKILRRNLKYLWSQRDSIHQLEIMSPTGWKKIKNIWETYKEVYSLDISNVEKIFASKEHKFSICHDVRRNNIENKEVGSIRSKNDWMTYKPIREFVQSTDKYIDLVEIALLQNEKKLYISGDSSIIKSRQPRSSPSWNEICNKYQYPIKKTKFGYETPLKRLMLKNLIPCDIAVGEKYYYKDKTIVSSSSKGKSSCLLKIDYNLGRLIGLYAAEGGTKSGRSRGEVKLTFHKKEVEYVNFVQKEVLKFGVKSNIKTVGNYIDIRFNSILIATMLRYFVTGKCKNKCLNMDIILNTNIEFRKGILEGAVEGDGSSRVNNGFSYTSASEQLVDDMKTLASSLDIICAKIKNKQFDKRSNKTHISYTTYTPYKNRKKRHDDTFAIYPRKISKTNNKKKMIDIEVDGGLFIIGDGLISHNSVKDRCTKSHEYVFLLTKQKTYFYDHKAIMEEAAYDGRKDTKLKGSQKYEDGEFLPGKNENTFHSQPHERWPNMIDGKRMRNKRSVWRMNTAQFKGGHFAVMPIELAQTCIKAGSEEGDWILDPFSGAATTGVAAMSIDRNYIGTELNPDFRDLSLERLSLVDPIFTEEVKNIGE